MKYDTYWYRSTTVAPLGDGFPWWKVKNNRLDGLMSNFYCFWNFPLLDLETVQKDDVKYIHYSWADSNDYVIILDSLHAMKLKCHFYLYHPACFQLLFVMIFLLIVMSIRWNHYHLDFDSHSPLMEKISDFIHYPSYRILDHKQLGRIVATYFL